MTEHQNKVVGISYSPEDAAPFVILKGVGREATAILNCGREGDVPVIKDPQLVRELYRVPIDTPIGRELFPVMATILAHVFQIDRNESAQTRSDPNS